MEVRKVRDAHETRQLLAAVAASGRPRAEWAREHGLDARSLNAWRLNLERVEGRGAPRLIELVTRSASTRTYRVRCGVFEVEVPYDFDEDGLVRLLRVVASC